MSSSHQSWIRRTACGTGPPSSGNCMPRMIGPWHWVESSVPGTPCSTPSLSHPGMCHRCTPHTRRHLNVLCAGQQHMPCTTRAQHHRNPSDHSLLHMRYCSCCMSSDQRLPESALTRSRGMCADPRRHGTCQTHNPRSDGYLCQPCSVQLRKARTCLRRCRRSQYVAGQRDTKSRTTCTTSALHCSETTIRHMPGMKSQLGPR